MVYSFLFPTALTAGDFGEKGDPLELNLLSIWSLFRETEHILKLTKFEIVS